MVRAMGRLLRFRRFRPLPEVEARIAALSDELPLTVAFVAAMSRNGSARAAAGVIEEQQASLRLHRYAMLRSLATRRRRVHAAMAGALAAVMLASGSYATVRAILPAKPAKAELIRRATVKLDEAKRIDTAHELAQIVDEVNETILALPEDALDDPKIRLDVAEFLGQAQSLLSSAPNAAELLAKVQRVADEVAVTPVIAEEQPTPEEKASEAPPARADAEAPSPAEG